MQMYGRGGKPFGRLKCTQATLTDDSEPIYRYPTNNQSACQSQPWSPTIDRLRQLVGERVGQEMNHCVGNLYQHGRDFIGPHADKMLDIMRGSCITTLSLGAERPMVLERRGADENEPKQSIQLPHGSLFVIGPETNRFWLHSIPAVDFDVGHRISLTIREVGSFFDLGSGRVTGQGSSAQTKNWPDWEHDMSIVPTVAHPRMQLLSRELRASTKQGGSTFECIIRPCSNHADVMKFHDELRAEFPEACHIPYAWNFKSSRQQQPSQLQQHQLRSQGTRRAGRGAFLGAAEAQSRGSASDGEPDIPARGLNTGVQGLLEPLLQAGLSDCAVFVVRHWDGKRLGAERLIKTYADATALAAAQSAE